MLGHMAYKVLISNWGGGTFSPKTPKNGYKIQSLEKTTYGIILIVLNP